MVFSKSTASPLEAVYPNGHYVRPPCFPEKSQGRISSPNWETLREREVLLLFYAEIAHLDLPSKSVAKVVANEQLLATLAPGAHLPDLLSKSRAVPGSAGVTDGAKKPANL